MKKKQVKKRILAALLTACILSALFPAGALAAEEQGAGLTVEAVALHDMDTDNQSATDEPRMLEQKHDISTGDLRLTAESCPDGCQGHIITGSTERYGITVSGGTHKIELRDVIIDVSKSSITCAFKIESAVVELTLSGANTLMSGSLRAGLQVPDGASVTINGNDMDSLKAVGGDSGAGIGDGYGKAGGTITVNGGAITAIGEAAGIGGSYGGSEKNPGGTVTINGGTVAATGLDGAGIGGGYGDGGVIIINGGTVIATGHDGAGIGGGGDYSGGGSITVNGGTVTATGGYSAGIGGGRYGAGGTIEITGGTVIATGDASSAGIGAGKYGEDGGTVEISGGTVTATGGENGAGIGGKNSAVFSTGADGNAMIIASSITDKTDREHWSGVIFEGDTGLVYGAPELTTDAEIPEGKILTIESGKTLALDSAVTLTNRGAITVETGGALQTGDGVFNNFGALGGDGTKPAEGDYNSNGSAVTLTVGAGHAVYGGKAIFTATVSAEPANALMRRTTPANTVIFYCDGMEIGRKTITGGRAACEITLNTAHWRAGSHSLTAEYTGGGEAKYLPSVSSPIALQVEKAVRLAPAAPTESTVSDTSVTVNTEEGQFYLCTTGDSAPETGIDGWQAAAGDSLQFTGLLPGTTYYFWTYIPENDYYNASGTSQSLTVKTKKAPAITTDSLPAGALGQDYSYTLTADGDLPIDWQIVRYQLPDGLKLDASSGAIEGTPTAAGEFSFVAVAKNPWGTDTKGFTISIEAGRPTVTWPTATLTYGVPLEEAVLTGGGAVGVKGEQLGGSFLWVDGSAVPAVSDSGKTRYSLTFQPFNTRDYSAITNPEMTLEVEEAELSLTLTANPVSTTAKQDVALTATITGAVNGKVPTGTVTFRSGANVLASNMAARISGGNLKATAIWNSVPAGIHELTAEYVPADMDDYKATYPAKLYHYSVDKANQSGFAFTGDTPHTETFAENGTFDLAATGGQTTGGVTYAVTSGGDVVRVDSAAGTVTMIKGGSATITATKAGDSDYNETNATQTIMILPADGALEISCADVVYGRAVAPEIKSNKGGGVTFQYAGRDGTSYELSATPPKDAGKYTVIGTAAATESYTQAVNTANFQIMPADSAVYITDRLDKTYDGGPISEPAATAQGSAAEVTFQWYAGEQGDLDPISGPPKDAGTYAVIAELAADKNYMSAVSDPVVFTIGRASVTVKATDRAMKVREAVPDLSEPKRNTDYTVFGLIGSDELTHEPTLSYHSLPDNTRTGTYTIQIDGAQAGNNYAVSFQTGTLTIEEKPLTGTLAVTGTAAVGETLSATLTDTNNTGELTYRWLYNGAELGNGETYVPQSGDAGHALSVHVTSSVESGTISALTDTIAMPFSGGGSTQTTKKNPDGSVTTTTKKPDGTVIEKTKEKDGTETWVETKKDGTVTETVKEPDGKITETVTTEKKQPDGSTVKTETVVEKRADGIPSAGATVVTDSKTGALTVPSGVLDKVADVPDSSLTVGLPGTELIFDNAAIQAIIAAGGEAPALTIAPVAFADLPTRARAQLTEATTYGFSVNGGGVDFGAGKVTVTLDYTRRHQDTDVAVYYIDDAGELTKVPGARFENGKVRFETSHWSVYAVVEEPQRFMDVSAGAWYADAVRYTVDRGLFSGTSNTSFSPDAPMTRAMLVTVLYRAAEEPDIEDEIWGYPFADVDAESWYGTAVYWARLKGITSGTGEETFSPDSSITREQLAAMLWRYAGAPAPLGTLDGFSDAEAAGDYAVDALRWAVEQGILTGKSGNVLDAKGEATRAEVAAMLMRYLTGVER